ncbi:MAG: hypothetical protein NTW87_24745 [Planctomycetota bacterium]|nr:hypothetical protein [Planctomycetota bacterium]
MNLKDLARRAGRPHLKGAEAKDNELRFGLKERICTDVAKKSPAAPPPLMAILAPNGDLVATEAGLVTADVFREFLGRAGKRPARAPAAPRPQPRPAAVPFIVAPYEYVRVDLGGGAFVFKGNGAGGEGPGVTTLQSLPDPYEMSGRKFGVGGFVCIYAANAVQEIGQIYLSAGSNAHGAHWMTFTNPPMRCVWENSGEGIMYYQPKIPPGVESLDYRVHENCYSVLVSPAAGCLSILGCPPAHRHYNGTVRVGARPMGVKMTHGEKKHWYAITCCAGDGTIAAVFLDAVDGEKAGDRIGETTYFDAATGKRLDFRPAAEQVIDTEGRGGGQKGFAKVPGRPGPVSQVGQTLKLEDVAILQTRNWSETAAPDDAKKAYLFVSCAGRNAVAVFDIGPFLKGAAKDLAMLGVCENIPNPKKLLLAGDHLYVGNNPGSTVTKIGLAKLPAVQPAKTEVIPVGKDPMGMAVGPEFGIGGILFVCNRGSDSVSMMRGNKELGRLDATNSAPLREPYGIWISGCSTRMIVSNFADEYATWWNFRLFPAGQVKDPKDVLISSDRIWTGAGVTAIDGDYGP